LGAAPSVVIVRESRFVSHITPRLRASLFSVNIDFASLSNAGIPPKIL
jgi:hypothetical protein